MQSHCYLTFKTYHKLEAYLKVKTMMSADFMILVKFFRTKETQSYKITKTLKALPNHFLQVKTKVLKLYLDYSFS